MSCEVWIFDGRAPELLCRAPSLPAARARWGHSRHAAIFDESGEVVDTKCGADASRLAAIEAARAGRVAPAKQPRPLPRAATEPMPEHPSEPPAQPVEASPEAPETPAKATRPAATRPPLPRRRTASVADDPLPSAPVATPTEAASVATAVLPASEPAPSSAPDADEAKVARLRRLLSSITAEVARLRRLLSSITAERDAHRDRADAAAYRIEQLRGEVEGLTTDLSVARHDLARAIECSGEMAADLGAQLDDALALLDLAMTAGLAAATEARAETDRVARHAGELSRRLAAAADAAPAAPVGVVDDLALARIARASERGTLRALGLSALVARHGGAEQVEQLLEGVDRLMKAVG